MRFFYSNIILLAGFASCSAPEKGGSYSDELLISEPTRDHGQWSNIAEPTPLGIDHQSASAASPSHGCQDGWVDSDRGLCWQNPARDLSADLRDAHDYCAGLGRGWRLPNINELLSLVRGCDQSQCGLSDPDCLHTGCKTGCNQCALDGGPDAGIYWPDALAGPVTDGYWSSSRVPGHQSAWLINFRWGGVYKNYISAENPHLRCVKQP